MGTRAEFEKDPLGWYTSFWLPSFAPRLMEKPPNLGHHALARLAAAFSGITIITQNVDGLHQEARPEWGAADRLIEAHGRVGLYKCSDDPGESVPKEAVQRSEAALAGDVGVEPTEPKPVCCSFASTSSIVPGMFPEASRLALGHGAGPMPTMTAPPACPSCGRPCMPQALLFDEVTTWPSRPLTLASHPAATFVRTTPTTLSTSLTGFSLGSAPPKWWCSWGHRLQ
jgi:NAD-dependent SIR2 family protein deacetylase